MIYKYLFYGVSYYVKKYDHLWHVEETYFYNAGLVVGLTIAFSIINIIRLYAIFYDHSLLMAHRPTWVIVGFPVFCAALSNLYFGRKRRCDKVYKEVKNMDKKKKKVYKILNLVHVIVVWCTFFILSDVIRNILARS